MTKHELNKRLAVLLGFTLHYGGKAQLKSENGMTQLRDYCSDWGQLMPLALEHGIYHRPSMHPTTGFEYLAEHISITLDGFSKMEYMTHSDDPAIAIVRCLIKKLSNEQDKAAW